MDFTNRFTINAPTSLVWDFMLNAQEVAPCVPGAQITETIDQTHFKGVVKVKLGAVQMQYRGDLAMEPDETARTLVLRAKGTEMRGSGGASGTFTTRLTDSSGGGTDVEILSHVDVTGRVAQFGRGIMQDVGNRLIKEFADCLEQKLRTRASAGTAATPESEMGATFEEQPRQRVEAEPGSAQADETDSSNGSGGVGDQSTAPGQVAPGSASKTSPPAVASELKVSSLLVSVLRSRVASGLRYLAQKIEPR